MRSGAERGMRSGAEQVMRSGAELVTCTFPEWCLPLNSPYQVPCMTGGRARALHAAGITRPDLLAVVSTPLRQQVHTPHS